MKKNFLRVILVLSVLLLFGCHSSNNLRDEQRNNKTTIRETQKENKTIFTLPNLPKTIVGQIAGGYVDIVKADVSDLGNDIYELTMDLDVTKYKPGTTGMGINGTYYYYVVVLDSSNNEVSKFLVESPNMLPGDVKYGKCQFSVKFPFAETGNYKIDFVKEDFGF